MTFVKIGAERSVPYLRVNEIKSTHVRETVGYLATKVHVGKAFVLCNRDGMCLLRSTD